MLDGDPVLAGLNFSSAYSGTSSQSAWSPVSGSLAIVTERPSADWVVHSVVKSNSRSPAKNDSSSGYQP